jgi:hypothetical protein
MTFKFPCPHCGQRLSAETSRAGETVCCPECPKSFVIPAPESATEAMQTDGPPVSVPPRVSAIPGVQLSFCAQVALLGIASFKAAKRGGRHLRMKAKIVKAKRVDLRRAQQALGRKSFENRVLPEKFAKQYDEIATLTKTIESERGGMKSAESATALERIKAFATSAKMKAGMHGLKLKQFYAQLGGELAADERPDSCQTEIAAVRGVEAQIQSWEKEIVASSADKSNREEMAAAWQALSSGRNRWYSVTAVCGVLLLIGISYRMLRTDGSQFSVQGGATAKGKVAAVPIKVGGTKREPTFSSPLILPSFPSPARAQNQTERDQSEKERLIRILGEDGWRKQDPTERDRREKARVRGLPIARNTGYKHGRIAAESTKTRGYNLSAAPSILQLDNQALIAWRLYLVSSEALEDRHSLMNGVQDAFYELRDAFKEAWFEGYKNGVVDVLKPEIERRKPAF